MTIRPERLLGLLLLFLLHGLPVTAQVDYLLNRSMPDLFTFFNPTAANIPPGSALASKGVIFLSSSGISTENIIDGTAFLINSNREDKKYCMVLAGHAIKSRYPGGTPIVNSAVHFNAYIYMDYLGRDSSSQGFNYTAINNFSKTYLSTGVLVAYAFDDINDGRDYALVLVNPFQLPSASFVGLGVDFSDINWAADSYYSEGFPLNYPLRLSDNLNLTENGANTAVMETRLPYALGPGFSGGPLLARTASGPVAKGLMVSAQDMQRFIGSYRGNDALYYLFKYTTKARFTKMSQLESAIRSNCWKKSDSANISVNELYKQAVTVANTPGMSAYSQNYILNSAAGLTEASAPVISETYPGGELVTNLHAGLCTIGGFTLPDNLNAGQPWIVTVAAKQINVTDLNYTPTGQSELDLAAVVIGSSASTSRQLSTQEDLLQENGVTQRFHVYPNPSSTGVFYVSGPATENYLIEVFSMAGQSVYRSHTSGTATAMQLSGLSRGTYLLRILDSHGKRLFTQEIIY